MMPDDKEETPPEFDRFRDLTEGLLGVTKEDLDEARKAESEAPKGPLPPRGKPALN